MKDGSVIRQSDIYFALKQRTDDFTPSQIIELVKTLNRYAFYYGCLLEPSREQSQEISERLRRLNSIEVTTGYPFLLNIYEDVANGDLSETDFINILDTLETFLVRRFVCNVPTNTRFQMTASLKRSNTIERATFN